MIDLGLLVVMSLAAYRLYRLLGVDDLPPIAGPRGAFTRWIDRHFGQDWADGIGCPWCLGFWCAGIVVGFVDIVVSVPLPVLQWAAASAVVGLIGTALDGD